MKLWLDDLRDPGKFRPGEDWHWTKTNTEFIRMLDTINPDYMEGFALDHDKSHVFPIEGSVLVAERACDETYEAGVRHLAQWALLHDKHNVPVEIITSNTAMIVPYKAILGDRFIITVNQGGCQRTGKS